jgi:hypothetical protein
VGPIVGDLDTLPVLEPAPTTGVIAPIRVPTTGTTFIRR